MNDHESEVPHAGRRAVVASRPARRRERDAAAAQGRRIAGHHPPLRDLRLRAGRHRLRLRAHESALVRRRTARRSCRRRRTNSARTATRGRARDRRRFGVRATKLTRLRRRDGRVRLRHVRRRRRRRPDDDPSPARVRAVRARSSRGQLETPFMDLDVFPNILDYWGPNGMIFFRNVQVQYRPIETGRRTRLAVRARAAGRERRCRRLRGPHRAGERHAALPVAGHLRRATATAASWGHVKLAGIWRDDPLGPGADRHLRSERPRHRMGREPRAGTTSSRASDVIRLQAIYGEGIQNYFNDAPVDVGVVNQFTNLRTPITGEALPIFGAVRLPRSHLEPRSSPRRSAGRWSTSRTATRRPATRSTTGSTRRPICSGRRCRT